MHIVRSIAAFAFIGLAIPAFAASTVAGCPVFPADNAWNTAVDTLPVHPSSGTWVATIGATTNAHPDFGSFYLGDPIGIPFVIVPPTQAPVTVTFDNPGESDAGPYPIPSNAPIEGGASSSGDRHVLALQSGTCKLYEMYAAYPAGGASWTAGSGAVFDLRSNALRPEGWTSADASGLSILAGLLRHDEFIAGRIEHAIRFTAPQTQGAHVWPATHDASTLSGTQYPPMGARFRLKASFDASTFSAPIQNVLAALKKYGMILADNGSPWFLSGEHNPAWDDGLLGELKRLKGSDFEAVDTSRMMVSATSAQAFPSPPAVTLRLVTGGLSLPTEIAAPPDGSGRLFVTEQGGRVRVIRNGLLLPTPFLDVSAGIVSGGEQGLLGLAFHPQYALNRRFFVYYTQAGTGAIRVSSFVANASNPDLADAASEQEVITIPHPGFTNHNGGHLAFGPDGYLYMGTGDGGSADDPPNNAQNLGVLLGKLLRLDVGSAPYSVPPTNPFVATPGARGEIYAYGLRNPWRFSFDRVTGDLYIGDVGQSTLEEIDFVPAGWPAGENFGWHVFEGTSCHIPTAGVCSVPNYTPPVLQHPRSEAQSITGGYVARGSSAALRGYYFYGDYILSHVWASSHVNTAWATSMLPISTLVNVSSFGEDERGDLHVASYGDGKIYAIEAAGPRVKRPLVDFNGDGRGDLAWIHDSGNQGVWNMQGARPVTFATASAGSGYTMHTLADFDGDGRTDILWRGADGSYSMQLRKGFEVAASATLLAGGSGWEVVGHGDFNGDGREDLLWRHTDGSYGIWLMNGTSIASYGVILPAGNGYDMRIVADFDGDGKADLLGVHTDGSVRLWLMNGAAGVAANTLLGPGTGWVPVNHGDFNGDGKRDLLWRHADGRYGIWLLDGFSPSAYGVVFYPADGVTITHVADVDGDGKADLIGTSGAGARVWLMDGMSGTGATTLAPAGWTPVHVDDFNGDLASDVVLRNADGSYRVLLLKGLFTLDSADVLGPANGWRIVP